MKERNIHKGSVKLVLNSKSGLNSPTSALKLRYGSLIIERGSFVRSRVRCRFEFCSSGFVWLSTFLYVEFCVSLGLVCVCLRWVFPLWSSLSLCLDSLHVLYRFSGFRFFQRNKYKHIRHCDYNFNHIVQFYIILLCK